MSLLRPCLFACAVVCGVAQGAESATVEERLRRLEATVERLSDENSALRRELGAGRAATLPVAAPTPTVAESGRALRIASDLRFRSQSTSYEAPGVPTRVQWLGQMHVALLTKLSETFEGAIRFSAGELNTTFGGTPLSAQFIAGDNASRKQAFIDQLFLRWRPAMAEGAKAAVTIGKAENVFYTPSRMLFDNDYMPEGATEEISFQVSQRDRLWFAAGQYVLDEIPGSSRDPWMAAVRAKWEAQWQPAWSTSLGVSWFNIRYAAALTAANVANNNRGNTRTPAGALVHGYRPFYADVTVTHLFEHAPGYAGKFPVTFSADALHNPAAPAQRDAWSAGLTIGKAGKAGQWEIGYRRVSIGADAWYEEMIEADYGAYYRAVPPGWNTDPASLAGGPGGGTNVRSHAIRTGYSPKDYLLLSANFFLNDLVRKIPANTTDTGARRFQLEALVRF